MTEFKPCPFCGGNAYVNKVKDDYLNYAVRCRRCRSSTTWFRGEEKAIDAWNRRADDGNE